jgi:hypothetical protein
MLFSISPTPFFSKSLSHLDDPQSDLNTLDRVRHDQDKPAKVVGEDHFTVRMTTPLDGRNILSTDHPFLLRL